MRRLLLIPLALLFVVPAPAVAEDTPKAAATRKKLQNKIDVEWKQMPLRDVIDELNDKVPALGIRADTKNGVQLNTKVTYQGKGKPVGEVLNALCDQYDLGYYLISNKANGYDGTVWLVAHTKERGTKGVEGAPKTVAGTKEKPDKTVKEKPEKPKPDVAKEKPKAEAPPDKPKVEDDPDETERIAGRRLKLAKELQGDGKADKAREVMEDLVKKYPKTKAAEEAEKLLKDQDK